MELSTQSHDTDGSEGGPGDGPEQHVGDGYLGHLDLSVGGRVVLLKMVKVKQGQKATGLSFIVNQRSKRLDIHLLSLLL